MDNDGDAALDCADSDCEGGTCGIGCTCIGLVSRETTCSDGRDNDGDTRVDCADPDCNGRTCNFGRVCTSGVCPP
jgi:hypothetical protein